MIEFELMGWGVVEVCYGIFCVFLLQGHGQKGCLDLYTKHSFYLLINEVFGFLNEYYWLY
jgi:hypothetical protein